MSVMIEQFHGVWQLADWSVRLADGRERYPFGGDVEGYLVYHPHGWMSATLMERGRPDVSQDRFAVNALRKSLADNPTAQLDDTSLATLRDYFLAANGYIGYSGPFDIDERSVHHRVRVSLIPQWVGTTLSRTFDFDRDGDRLTLSAEQGDFTDRLVWERGT